MKNHHASEYTHIEKTYDKIGQQLLSMKLTNRSAIGIVRQLPEAVDLVVGGDHASSDLMQAHGGHSDDSIVIRVPRNSAAADTFHALQIPGVLVADTERQSATAREPVQETTLVLPGGDMDAMLKVLQNQDLKHCLPHDVIEVLRDTCRIESPGKVALR